MFSLFIEKNSKIFKYILLAIFFLLKEYDSQEKIFIPVGTAITIVAAVK